MSMRHRLAAGVAVALSTLAGAAENETAAIQAAINEEVLQSAIFFSRKYDIKRAFHLGRIEHLNNLRTAKGEANGVAYCTYALFDGK